MKWTIEEKTRKVPKKGVGRAGEGSGGVDAPEVIAYVRTSRHRLTRWAAGKVGVTFLDIWKSSTPFIDDVLLETATSLT